MRVRWVPIILLTLLLTGCGAGAQDSSAGFDRTAAATQTATEASSSDSTTELWGSSDSATPTADDIEETIAAPAPVSVSVSFGCSVLEDGDVVSGDQDAYTSLKAVWASGKAYNLCTATRNDAPWTKTETQAVKTAYGDDHSDTPLDSLYAVCAQTAGIPIDEIRGPSQGVEVAGAMLLCPKHPKIESMKVQAAAGRALAEEQHQVDVAKKNKKFAAPGSYLMGKDLVPGTYQSVGQSVSECYWEISDAQGKILANNFISVAPKLTISIPATASGFTARGCGFVWVAP